MSYDTDLLERRLATLADDAAPADLLDGALRRSRQIGRRRAGTATAAVTVAVLAVAAGGWQLVGTRQGHRTIGTATGAPAASATAERSFPQLPGTLYYVASTKLVRIERGQPVPVADWSDWPASDDTVLSPDATRIAMLTTAGTLQVTTLGDGVTRTVAHGLASPGGVEPAWLPDSSRILVGIAGGAAAILDTRTGTRTPLSHDPHGMHYHWSVDGSRMVFATDNCRVATAAPDGSDMRIVPNIGDPHSPDNPLDSFSCYQLGASDGAALIALTFGVTKPPPSDTRSMLFGNKVVSGATGKLVPLPVGGDLLSVYYQVDGSTLYRTEVAKVRTLTLVAGDGHTVGTVTEPGALGAAQLVAYVP